MNFNPGLGLLTAALQLALVIGAIIWFVRAVNRIVAALESLAESARDGLPPARAPRRPAG